MNKFGNVYKTAEFIGKTISKNPINLLLQGTVDFLKTMDEFQTKNPLITLSAHAGDGIWFYYKGVKLFFIKPTQKHIMFHIFKANKLSKAILKQHKLFNDEWSADYAYKVWRIGLSELQWLQEYIEKNCPMPAKEMRVDKNNHSRFIPGEIRQAVLEDFISKGSYCSGIAGITKKHKLKPDEEIEFDHILPWTKGGSNTFYNVQILCMKCNRIKGATAK